MAGCSIVVASGLYAVRAWGNELLSSSLVQFHHTSWTSRDGAPADAIMIAQTDDGFLWFATGTGLVRFDGVQFERYLPSPGESLPTQSIRSLLPLPGNALLIGWVFGGATLLQNGHTRFFGEREGYPSGSTYQFLRDRDGTVWAANSSGLFRFDGERWQPVGAESNLNGTRALSLMLDRDGALGVMTDHSLMVLPQGASAFHDTGIMLPTRSPAVQSADGTFYLADRAGIHLLSDIADGHRNDRMLVVNEPDFRVDKPMIVDRDGVLWFGSDRGVGRIAYPELTDAKIEYFAKSDGLSGLIDTLFEDRNGSIWAATIGGVDQFRKSSFAAPTGLLQAGLPALLRSDNGDLMFAGMGRDLRRLSPDGTVQKIAPIFVTCAYRDPRGVEWYGSQPRAPAVAELIRRESGKTTRVSLPPDVPPDVDIQSIVMDADGVLWVSVIRHGIYKLKDNSWSQPAELPDSGKQAAIIMIADSLGRVWLGYPANRLVRWEKGSALVYSQSDGLGVGNVLAIHQSGSHLWVGGDQGLALFKSGRFRAIKMSDEVVVRGITGILETKNGDLWLHGRSGAIRAEATEVRRALREPGSRMTFRLFDENDGLYGLPTDIRPLPTLVEGATGTLWFGTYQGPFSLDPQKIVTNPLPPTVILKELRAGGARYFPGPSNVLPAHSSSLQFEYTATGLAIAERARFRYRLFGVDADWQEAFARREAFYTNLGPGRYRFQVIASNENGVWSLTGASMEFSILPAWYQTLWFRMLCAFVAVGVLLLLFRLRLAQMRKQLHARLQGRLLERERIARELHDTLIQGFQGLVLLFGAIRQRIPPEHPAREMMSNALMRANEVLAEGRDRVRGLRDSIGLQSDIATALRDVAGDLMQVHPGEFSLSVTGAPQTLIAAVMTEAYQIGREALANAYSHAAAQHVNLEIAFFDAQFRLRVTDDGKGIDACILRDGGIAGHFGMRGMQERSRKIEAKLAIRSGPGSGTEVELLVPGEVAYGKKLGFWRYFGLRPLNRGDHDDST